jgi:hypothetical protein
MRDRFEAEELLNQTPPNPLALDLNETENTILKSTIMAKYITLDKILDEKHHLSEAQLKRVLY